MIFLVCPLVLLLMMSAMETPFGPSGRRTLTRRDDTVVSIDSLGGPKIATDREGYC